jgi:hypothetical protein
MITLPEVGPGSHLLHQNGLGEDEIGLLPLLLSLLRDPIRT